MNECRYGLPCAYRSALDLTKHEAEIRADERKKVLDEVIGALSDNLNTFVDNDRWTSDGSLMWKIDEVKQAIEQMKGEQT